MRPSRRAGASFHPTGLGKATGHQSLTKSHEKTTRKIPFEAKKELPIFYKGEKIEKKHIPDVFCFGKIILEPRFVS